MKKRLLTATLVASCAGLLVYTAFYHKGVDVGVAQKHQNTQGDFKKYTPTNKESQIDAFKRLMENHTVADADNTNTVYSATIPTINTIVEPAKVTSTQTLALTDNASFKEYNVASNASLRITNAATGTTLNIKPNTFVNEYGEVAEGTVHVAMREMHSAPEFFLAGLPMNGYESAGVVELNATSENGSPLFIDNEKPVEVLMASTNANENYSVYKLGETMNSWQLKNAGLRMLTPAAPAKKKKFSGANISLSEVRGQFHLFKKELCFKMQLNPQVFPEMQAYNDIAWVYTGKHAKTIGKQLLKDLANTYASRRRGNLLFNYWSDVKLFKAENGEFRLLFSFGKETLDIPVKPESMYGYPINPEAMYDEYTKLLAEKKVKETDVETEQVDNTFDPSVLPAGYSRMARFTIDECGIWGLNHVVNYGYSLNTNISFTDEAGTALTVTKLYQYDAAINSYQQIDLGSALSMGYTNANSNVIFAVTGSNEVALLSKKAFIELVKKANSSYTLTAKMARKQINTVGDVVALFNS